MIDVWTGSEVRALRRALRMTQEQFAEVSKYSVRTIGKWEQDGRQTVLGGRAADRMDTLLGGLTAGQRRRLDADRQPSAAEMVMSPAETCSLPDRELWAWVEMNRRELLHLFAGGLPGIAAILAGLDMDERARVTQVVVDPARVDDATVTHVEAALAIALAQNDIHGPKAVLNMVSTQRDIASALLRESSPALRRRLLALHSKLSQLAGWMQFDLGNFSAARSRYEEARESAHSAGEEDLAALVLCNMSYLATWSGSPRIAIDHAVAAQNWARSAGDMLLRAYADDIAAIAQAGDGRERECRLALDSADTILAAMQPEEGSTSVAYFHGSGLAAGFRGDCLLQLGHTGDATIAAARSLALVDRRFVRNRAIAYLDLAKAYLADGEVEQAARMVGAGAQLATTCRSHRIAEMIEKSRRSLGGRHQASCVQELNERLDVYGFGRSHT